MQSDPIRSSYGSRSNLEFYKLFGKWLKNNFHAESRIRYLSFENDRKRRILECRIGSVKLNVLAFNQKYLIESRMIPQMVKTQKDLNLVVSASFFSREAYRILKDQGINYAILKVRYESNPRRHVVGSSYKKALEAALRTYHREASPDCNCSSTNVGRDLIDNSQVCMSCGMTLKTPPYYRRPPLTLSDQDRIMRMLDLEFKACRGNRKIKARLWSLWNILLDAYRKSLDYQEGEHGQEIYNLKADAPGLITHSPFDKDPPSEFVNYN